MNDQCNDICTGWCHRYQSVSMLEVSAHHLSTSKNENGKHSNAACISSLDTLQDYDIRNKAEGIQPLGFDSCTGHWLTRLIDGLNVEALYTVIHRPCYVQPGWSDAH